MKIRLDTARHNVEDLLDSSFHWWNIYFKQFVLRVGTDQNFYDVWVI